MAVCAGELESFTCTVTGNIPSAVGVPLIWPLEAFNESPDGKEPDVIDQVYGVVPPEAVRLVEYTAPCCASGNEVVVTCTGVTDALEIVIEKLFVDVCAGEDESVTLTVKDDVPAAVGVPLICPALLKESPAGSEPELIDQLYGVVPPLATRNAE